MPTNVSAFGVGVKSFGHCKADYVVGALEQFGYAPEREFLEKIKYAFDYMPEEVILAQPDNPKYAVHFRGRDNGKVEEGALTIRRFKAKPEYGLSEDKPRSLSTPVLNNSNCQDFCFLQAVK